MEALIVRRRRRRIARKIFKDRENPFEYDDVTFFKRYRFTKLATQFIIGKLSKELQRNTARSKAIPPYLTVLTSLNILASGSFQYVTGGLNYHQLNQPTISKVFKEFLNAIQRHIKDFINFPTTLKDINLTKMDFYKKSGFPNVIGCIDGIQIPINKPNLPDADTFYNRKGYLSINVQAVCNAQNIFTDVVVRWPGSTNDSHVFKCSGLSQFLLSNRLPENSWLLGDNQYPLLHCLMTPIVNPTKSTEICYNNRHKATRKIMDQTLDLLKKRFRIIGKTEGAMCYGLEKCVQIITACFILHNIAKLKNVPDIKGDDEDTFDSEYENFMDSNENVPSQVRGNALRKSLVHYNFTSGPD